MKTRSMSAAILSLLLGACATHPPTIPPVQSVDLPRFMGDWYVIAAIPTVRECSSYRPMDSYRLEADGTVATAFPFNNSEFDGARKQHASRGFVVAGSGYEVWSQQYVWPIKADYRIAFLAADYSQVVVAREKRDYVWIMARTPTIDTADLDRLTAFVAAQGYDTSLLRRMPQAGGR
jgi:apolipoprotein D and lipocalin family protein